jgi:uncharacterized membrane protein YbaN (DUF454 family)
MNGDKYTPILEQLKKEKAVPEKVDLVGVIICMFASEFSPLLKRTRRLEIVVAAVLVILLLAMPKLGEMIFKTLGLIG